MNEKLYQANIKLQDENNVLKDDKRILNLRVEEKDKVINDLLSKIATLEYEVERLESIYNDLEKYSKDRYYEEKKLEHYARLNAYKDILDKIKELKGSDKE